MLPVMTPRRSRSRARSLAATGFALLVTGATHVAWACPACLGADAKNASFLKIGGLFVLLPFFVVGLVLYVLRNAPERERAERRAPLPRA
jgi:predicted branched-subunit amino acid permease